MISNAHRVTVVSGSAGVVTRIDQDLVVIGGRSATVAVALGEIAAGGIDLAARLRGVRDVDVAAIVASPGGFEVVTLGNGSVTTPDGRPVEPSSAAVWVGIGPVPSDASARLEASPHLDLQRGSVPGQGALVAAPVGVDPHPAEPGFDVVDLHAPADTDPRAPLPIVESAPEPPVAPPSLGAGVGPEVMGIRCSRDHFNNPQAAYCQVCGISMVHMTHYLVPGPRPTLGFLVFDDGSTFALDRSYCVGREPVIAADRDLAPLVLPDDRHSVSRSHAELVLDGWDLIVHDLGSTNGTFVWNADHQQWTQVVQGQPVIVAPGTSVAIGRKVFVYEPVARAISSP